MNKLQLVQLHPQFDKFTIKNKSYKIFPVWYPVGIGSMNKHKAIARLKAII